MCGIAGIFKFDPDQRVSREALKAMADTLKNEIVNRKKQGFVMPLRKWLKHKKCDNVLKATYSSTEFNTSKTTKLMAENTTGQIDHGTLLWRLLLLQSWFNKAVA